MLRSAINTVAAAARHSRHSAVPRALLSTVSFPTSSFSHDHHYSVESRGALTVAPTPMPSYQDVTSYVSSIIATLSGDWTLTTVEKAVAQLEEEGEWEDIATVAMAPPESTDYLSELSLWQISTLKRRKKKMNKHKLRKRRKKMRLKTRK